MKQIIIDSQPKRLDLIREQMVEWLLTHAHTLDPRGRLERRIAKFLRPGAYKTNKQWNAET